MNSELILPSGQVVPVRDHRSAVDLELRDPKASTVRHGWTSPVLPQLEEWDAAQAIRLGYLANVIAYRCIQIRANAIARIPLVAGRKLNDHGTIREDAPIARLLGPPPGGPAPKLSARKLIRWTVAQEIVTGRRAWEIETHDGTASGRPVAFWPLSVAHLRATPSTGGTEWFKVFEYGPGPEPIKLPPELVFYGWDPGQIDFRQPESALQSARFDLSLVNLCDRYGIGFLRNNAVPAAIVTTTKFPTAAAKRRFLDAWRSEYSGPDNAGRVALNEVGDDGEGPVGDSIDVKQLGVSAKDARLIETRRDVMMEIAMALGTPWSKLDASGRTFDNAEIEDRTWHEDTILPDLLDLQDDINMQLAPRLGDEVVWFDLRSVPALRNRRFRSLGGVAGLLDRRVVTPNEVREDLELDPVDGGDEMLPMAAVEPDPAEQISDHDGDRPEEDEPDDERSKKCPETMPGNPANDHRERDPEEAEARRALIWRATDAVVSGIEQRWERALRRLFSRQADATIARLTGKRGRQALNYGTDGQPAEERAADDPIVVDEVFSRDFWRAATIEVVEDLYHQVLGASIDRLTVSYGISFDLSQPWVDEFITTRANQLAGHVTQTTYDQITRALADGVAAGESIDDLVERVRQVFTQADDYRARTIARTEVIGAYNGAAMAGAERMPSDVVAAAEWIATRDSRVRDSHAAADGQVQPRGAPFAVGGFAMAYPGDPAAPPDEVVNCRCTVAFLSPGEYAEIVRATPRRIEARQAKALVALVPFGDHFDLLGLRRALEVSAT